MEVLGWGVIGYPLIMGILLMAAGRYLPKTLRDWATAGSAGVVLACLLIALLLRDANLSLSSEWWPGKGPLYFKFEFWGLMAAFWTTASGLIFYLTDMKDRHAQTWWQDGLFLFVLTTANSAFLAGNFLLRYAALEFAALGIAVVQLLAAGSQSSQRLYLGLRLGDAGLLIAIILLIYSGTSLDISLALGLAGELPEVILQWIAIGFALAVWVKAGLWPFVFWQNAAAETTSMMTRAWFLATVMPNLGMYLLFRTAPLLTRTAPIQNMISLLAAVCALAALIYAWGRKDLQESMWGLFAFLGAVTMFAAVHHLEALVWGGMLTASLLRFLWLGHDLIRFPAAARERLTRFSGGLLLGIYAFVVIWAVQQQGDNKVDFWIAEASLALLILWLVKSWKETSPAPRKTAANWPDRHEHELKWGMLVVVLLFIATPLLFTPLHASEISTLRSTFTRPSLTSLPLLSPAFWGLLLVVWIVSKLRWFEKFESLTSRGWRNWSAGARQLPQTLYKSVEVDIYQQGMNQAAQIITRIARRLYEVFEQATLEAGLHLLVQGFLAVGRLLSRAHTGRLRVNLMWVAAVLIAVLIIGLNGAGG